MPCGVARSFPKSLYRCLSVNIFKISARGQLPQSKDMGLVAHDLTVSGNSATSLLPHYTWLHLGG